MKTVECVLMSNWYCLNLIYFTRDFAPNECLGADTDFSKATLGFWNRNGNVIANRLYLDVWYANFLISTSAGLGTSERQRLHMNLNLELKYLCQWNSFCVRNSLNEFEYKNHEFSNSIFKSIVFFFSSEHLFYDTGRNVT